MLKKEWDINDNFTPIISVRNAFSEDVRKKIILRDRGKCTDCDKSFATGWIVECSHYDHDRNNPNYNDPSNGRLQCLDHHLQYTVQTGDNYAANLIQARIRGSHGGRTKDWLQNNKT